MLHLLPFQGIIGGNHRMPAFFVSAKRNDIKMNEDHKAK